MISHQNYQGIDSNFDKRRQYLVLQQRMFEQKQISIGLITVTLIDLLLSAILKVQSFVSNPPLATGYIAFQFCLFELAFVEMDHFNTKCLNYVSMFRIQIRSNQYYQYYIVKHFESYCNRRKISIIYIGFKNNGQSHWLTEMQNMFWGIFHEFAKVTVNIYPLSLTGLFQIIIVVEIVLNIVWRDIPFMINAIK